MKQIGLICLFLIIGVLVLGPIIPLPVTAENDTLITKIPLVETLNLRVDGSITPVSVLLTLDYDYVGSLVFGLDYDDPDYVAVNFAANGSLANGTCMIVNNAPFWDFNITQNNDFNKIAYDIDIIHDDADPKETHIHARFNFDLFCPGGLPISSSTSLYFIVQDNITAAASGITTFVVVVEGYQIDRQAAPKQYLINPFEYFDRWARWAVTQPLVWAMIILGFVVIIYIFRSLIR